MIKVINNFFPNFEYIKDSFKKISLYEQKEFNEKFNETQTWPGKRSALLNESAKFLTLLFSELVIKHNALPESLNNLTFNLYTHLRLEKDHSDDWVHQDISPYAGIVFLSKTNTDSGTLFYDRDKKTVLHKISAVENTAVFFHGNIFHKSGLNYGDNIDNGRLTLNSFFFYR